MTKSTSDAIKEAAAGETDPKALGAATDTPALVPQGDGRAPYREDFEAVYHRLDTLEAAVALLTERLSLVPEPDDAPKSVEERVARLEKRLEGNIA